MNDRASLAYVIAALFVSTAVASLRVSKKMLIFLLAGILSGMPFSLLADDDDKIEVLVSPNAWPCFIWSYEHEKPELIAQALSERLFIPSNVFTARLSSDSNFLSEDKWAKLCHSTYKEAQSLGYRDDFEYLTHIEFKDPVYNFETSEEYIDLRILKNHFVSVEIYWKAASQLNVTENYGDIYSILSTVRIANYYHAAICSHNEDIRVIIPSSCNYEMIDAVMNKNRQKVANYKQQLALHNIPKPGRMIWEEEAVLSSEKENGNVPYEEVYDMLEKW